MNCWHRWRSENELNMGYYRFEQLDHFLKSINIEKPFVSISPSSERYHATFTAPRIPTQVNVRSISWFIIKCSKPWWMCLNKKIKGRNIRTLTWVSSLSRSIIWVNFGHGKNISGGIVLIWFIERSFTLWNCEMTNACSRKGTPQRESRESPLNYTGYSIHRSRDKAGS